MLVYADSTSLAIRKTDLWETSKSFFYFSLFHFALLSFWTTLREEMKCLAYIFHISSTEVLSLDKDIVATVLSVKACWSWRCRSTNF